MTTTTETPTTKTTAGDRLTTKRVIALLDRDVYNWLRGNVIGAWSIAQGTLEGYLYSTKVVDAADNVVAKAVALYAGNDEDWADNMLALYWAAERYFVAFLDN